MAIPMDLPMHSDGHVVVVIETPSGSGNKLKFDDELGIYRLERVLPAGMTFPFAFGFIPETVADDGRPPGGDVPLRPTVLPRWLVLARTYRHLEARQPEKRHRKGERNY